MDLRVTFEISDKFEAALLKVAAAIQTIKVCANEERHPEAVGYPAQKAEIAPETHEEPVQAITQPEPEIGKPEPILEQHEAVPEPSANENVEPEPAKKAKIAPEKHEETAQVVTQPEPEIVKPEPVLEQPEPKKEAQPTTDDGMGGMSLMEASQQLIKDIQDAGVEMADANARVRAKANELGLNYASITCLIKAIGYVEARKAAIGK